MKSSGRVTSLEQQLGIHKITTEPKFRLNKEREYCLVCFEICALMKRISELSKRTISDEVGLNLSLSCTYPYRYNHQSKTPPPRSRRTPADSGLAATMSPPLSIIKTSDRLPGATRARAETSRTMTAINSTSCV